MRQTPDTVVEFMRNRGYTLDTLPTLRELQSLCGGSLATMSKAVSQYRIELERDAQSPMLDDFKATFDAAAKAAWSVAVNAQETAVAIARDEAEEDLDELRKECERLEALNADLRAEVAATKKKLEDAKAAAAEAKARASVADENAAHLVADIERLREALATAREERAEAVGALKAFKERGAELF